MPHHVNSLDGLRGIAILLVVLFHTGLFAPGWIGVQIFFVLSGYLITGILLEEKERDFSDYLARFYWRRSLRIFPLYFLFLAVVALCFSITSNPPSFERDWPFLISYTTNFARLRQADIGPYFVHLWSLAVEEQFYLIWPVLVFLLPARQLRRLVAAIVVAVPVLRLGFYVAFDGRGIEWIGRNIYCLSFFQFDAFSIGASIILFRLDNLLHPMKSLVVLSVICATAGGAAMACEQLLHHDAFKYAFGYPMYLLQGYQFVWGYTLLDGFSAVFLISALNAPMIVGALSREPLVRLGKISYAVYVFHLPIFHWLASLQLSRALVLPIGAILTLISAELSFRFLETPFLNLKDYLPFHRGSRLSSETTLAAEKVVRPG